MVQKKNTVWDCIDTSLQGKATSFEFLFGRTLKNGYANCDPVDKEHPKPKTSSTISNSYSVFGMVNWDRKNELLCYCLGWVDNPRYIIKKRKHAVLPQKTSNRAIMKHAGVPLLIQKDANKIAWFKNKWVNKLMQDKWILCLYRSICAHNTFNSNLQPPNSGMQPGNKYKYNCVNCFYYQNFIWDNWEMWKNS